MPSKRIMAQRSDNNFELLSPAGDFDSLKAAVVCGANAVYLGLGDYNARSKAKNFSLEELRLALIYCHERNVKVYLTMNTLLKDDEINKALKLAVNAIDEGIDGIILQDLGLLKALQNVRPDFSYHASTQLGVHNAPGIKAAEKMGFKRVVLSRETLSEDIEEMNKTSKVEKEFFIHGAHCVSFSGNCYFSSLVSGYSGNRGKCLQLCRKKYTLSGEGKTKKGYMLSTKDICLVKDLKKVKSLGILSGKIEGRLRSKEYAGITAQTYSKALKGVLNASDLDKLKVVFNRGDYSSAYLNSSQPYLIYDEIQSNIGLKIGRVVSYRKDLAFFSLSSSFNVRSGDGVKLIKDGRELCGGFVILPNKIKMDRICNVTGALIYLTKSKDLSEEIEEKVKKSGGRGSE
ncbi:MAG: U32 family peptidase [Clostridia bacterium]|nr:U32 family peptidase [Clostridia bacterium]